MKVIDFHTHCFADEIAEKALEVISLGYRLTPCFNGTCGDLLKHMDESGVWASVVVPVATKPSQVQPINDWVLRVRSERIIGFGSMHPDFPDIPGEFDRMAKAGIPGIKIQANWQGYHVDDPHMFPIYEAAKGRFIIVFHAGGELKEMEEQLATPERLANVHRLYPDLTMIAAHMGGYRMWDEVEECLLGEDVYFDLSCCFPADISDERLVSMIRRHGPQKILFGSDAPCASPGPQLKRLMSLPLTDAEKEMIAGGNAARLLRIE